MGSGTPRVEPGLGHAQDPTRDLDRVTLLNHRCDGFEPAFGAHHSIEQLVGALGCRELCLQFGDPALAAANSASSGLLSPCL